MNLVIVWTMWFSIDYRSSFIINTDIEFAPHILGNYFMPLNLMVHRHHLSYNNYTIHTSIHTCHYRDTHTDTCNIRRSRVATTTSRSTWHVQGPRPNPPSTEAAPGQLAWPDWMSDSWRALLKASLPTAWQQARGRPMDPVRRAITSFAESLIWPTYRQARTASSSLWLSCRSGCLTQPPSLTSQRSGTYISQRGTETHWPTPHVLTWY